MLNISDYLSLQPLASFFQAYPYSSGILAFTIVFLETLAVVGVAFPGAIIMPFIGFLIGSQVIPFGSTFICVIAGAIAGDYSSYYIGIYFQDRIHRMWPFTRWPTLLEQGEKYFHVHGGKSVFIGRFVFVVRVVIPMIAGMLKMPFVRFSVAAIPSALIWSVGYIFPGILLGALSLELPPKVAGQFTLWAFTTIIALWLFVWFVRHFFKQTWKMIDRFVVWLWKYCKQHKTLRWLTDVMSDPRKPDNHQQLFLLIIAILVFAMFFFTTYQVFAGGFLTYLNKPIYYLLSGMRTKQLDCVFTVITALGSGVMLAIASSLFLAWLIFKRYWYVAVHWFANMVLIIGVIVAAKYLMYFPRPGVVAYEKLASSFPSAHTALSTAFYGLLAVIVARESKKQNRYVPYIVSGLIVTLIIFSRLYLGVHWLTDVWAGVLMGGGVLLLVTISYRRHCNLHFSGSKITLAAITIFAAVWIGYTVVKFNKRIEEYSLVWPQKTISFAQLPDVAPLYRLNRFGHVVEALNVEWIGNIDAIKQSLLKQGWESRSAKIGWLNVAEDLFDYSAPIHHLPISPQLYHNRPPALLLVKDLEKDSTMLVLRLWVSDISLKDINLPVWIGSLKYHRVDSKKLSLSSFKNKPTLKGATDVFSKYLEDFYWMRIEHPQDQQPSEMTKLQWDGKVLVVKDVRT